MERQILFPAHIAEMKRRANSLCEHEGYELLAIHAGQPKRQFLDDMEYPFKPNPHFKAWCPLNNAPHSWVLITPQQEKPTLVILNADEFWVEQPKLDQASWLTMFHVELISRPDQIDRLLPYDKSRAVYLGEHLEVAQALGFTQVNSEPALSYFNYYRALKTDYEQQCVRVANRIAIQGHRAVALAWQKGASEFDCLLAYIAASRQGENDVPYPHIIGQNEHAAILHYRGKSLTPLGIGERRSLMIDAGANWLGYGADISRTYAGADASTKFNDLIQMLDQVVQSLVAQLKPGMAFADLHGQAHLEIARVLAYFELCSLTPEDMVAKQISHVFMPHGIGHLLGLQVHDVGGNLLNERGALASSPPNYPKLKTTRELQVGMVFTIEPGIYFIPSLLNQLQDSAYSSSMNWQVIAELSPYGGIRIEDNIILHADRTENITRELGLY